MTAVQFKLSRKYVRLRKEELLNAGIIEKLIIQEIILGDIGNAELHDLTDFQVFK